MALKFTVHVVQSFIKGHRKSGVISIKHSRDITNRISPLCSFSIPVTVTCVCMQRQYGHCAMTWGIQHPNMHYDITRTTSMDSATYLPTVPILEGQSLFLEQNFLLSHFFLTLSHFFMPPKCHKFCIFDPKLCYFRPFYQFVPLFD